MVYEESTHTSLAGLVSNTSEASPTTEARKRGHSCTEAAPQQSQGSGCKHRGRDVYPFYNLSTEEKNWKAQKIRFQETL